MARGAAARPFRQRDLPLSWRPEPALPALAPPGAREQLEVHPVALGADRHAWWDSRQTAPVGDGLIERLAIIEQAREPTAPVGLKAGARRAREPGREAV